MCTPCVYHKKPMSLDVTPNPNSFQTLPNPSRPLVLLDRSRLYHMTSRSRALPPLQTNNITIYLCPANPNPSQSLSALSSYNTVEVYKSQLSLLVVATTCRNGTRSMLTSAKLSVGYLVVGITRELNKEPSLHCSSIYINTMWSMLQQYLLALMSMPLPHVLLLRPPCHIHVP